MSRLFAAILPDDPFRDALETLAGGAVTLAGGGKVTPRENFHLTLAFLGETSRQEAALEGLMAVEAPAFSLEPGPGGFFPGHRGNTLWQGVKPCPSLAALQRQLWSELTRRGFSLEDRPFLPHFTLARGSGGKYFSSPPPSALPFLKVSSVWLMESIFTGSGVRYHPIGQRQLNHNLHQQ